MYLSFLSPCSKITHPPPSNAYRCRITLIRWLQPLLFVYSQGHKSHPSGCPCAIQAHRFLWGCVPRSEKKLDDPLQVYGVLLCRYSQDSETCGAECKHTCRTITVKMLLPEPFFFSIICTHVKNAHFRPEDYLKFPNIQFLKAETL